ncbi:MAG: peroxide stress protein YaaA, partial [Chloroflexota bacterium]
LNGVRAHMLEALISTSSEPDALKRLLAGDSLADEVDRNTQLRGLPTRPVLEVYTGTLHGGLDYASLSPGALRRAKTRVVIASALFGLLRPGDRIPPYRMNICSRLQGIDGVEATWRTVLPAALAEAAGPRGPIFDLRSASYQAAGIPSALADRWITMRADGADGGRVGNVFIKRARGEAARHLLESGRDPSTPERLAAILAERWDVNLTPPPRAGKPWTLALLLPA